jgi:hypothetical protein
MFDSSITPKCAYNQFYKSHHVIDRNQRTTPSKFHDRIVRVWLFNLVRSSRSGWDVSLASVRFLQPAALWSRTFAFFRRGSEGKYRWCLCVICVRIHYCKVTENLSLQLFLRASLALELFKLTIELFDKISLGFKSDLLLGRLRDRQGERGLALQRASRRGFRRVVTLGLCWALHLLRDHRA